jgi:hypothetical protein
MADLLSRLIRHCPYLHTLSLTFIIRAELDPDKILSPPSVSPGTAVSYNGIPLPRIQALRIDSQASHTLTMKIIQSWPSIRHLVVSGRVLGQLCLSSSANGLETLDAIGLYEFQISGFDYVVPYTAVARFTASLQNSLGTLRILDLRGIRDLFIGLLETLFEGHGPYLQSLRLPKIGDAVKLSFLKHCMELKEIVVNGHPPDSLLTSCPVAKIQHASFRMFRNDTEFQQAIRWLHTFPALAVLSWSMQVGNEHAIAQLHEFGRQNNVRIRTTTSVFEAQVRNKSLLQNSPA